MGARSLTATIVLFRLTSRISRNKFMVAAVNLAAVIDGQAQAYAWPMARLCFYSKTAGFWPSYCQISTDLDKILQTPIVVRKSLVG